MSFQPKTPEWHEARRSGIGSSDAPIITGDLPPTWGDPIVLLQQLYATKTGDLPPEDRDSNPLQWGQRLEDVVAGWYAEVTGRKVRRANVLRRHRDHHWMIANLDRVAGRRVVEVKTAPFGGDAWGEPGTAEVPAHVLVQVMHQLAVTGYPVADVPVLISGADPRLYTIERDEEMIAALIQLEREFWACVVERRRPDYEALLDKQRRVRPRVEGEVDAGPELDRLIEDARDAGEMFKAAEKYKEERRAELKAAIDPYAIVHGSNFDVTYRPNKPTTNVTWELVAKAYRAALEDVERAIHTGTIEDVENALVDVEAVQSLFTVTEAGARPLRITERRMRQP